MTKVDIVDFTDKDTALKILRRLAGPQYNTLEWYGSISHNVDFTPEIGYNVQDDGNYIDIVCRIKGVKGYKINRLYKETRSASDKTD